MGVGGSKGSLCANFAMENADLLIAVGTRAVCQSDSSRTGYPAAARVVNINADLADATHYNRTLALLGDVRLTLQELNRALREKPLKADAAWPRSCAAKKADWQALKVERFQTPVLPDEYWGSAVMTQPAAIKIALDWAGERGAVVFFDAGDVQANGFQIAEDDHPDRTFTETGASYMGFATSALLATAAASQPFYALALTGDGSFTMNPQILIDGLEHGAHGCILILDKAEWGRSAGCNRHSTGRSLPRAAEFMWTMQPGAEPFPAYWHWTGGARPSRYAPPCTRPVRTRASP